MEIQQHDGVVVDVAGSRQGFAKLLREGEGLQGEREAPGARVWLPSRTPTIYRTPRGAPALGDGISMGGGSQGGGLPPKASGGAPHPRVSNPRRRGAQGGAHQPTRGWFPSHFSPRGPPR